MKSAHPLEISTADLGFWPSTGVLKLLQIIESTTVLPWWATVIGSTVLIRSLMLPLAIKMMRGSSRMARIRPELEAMKEYV